MIANTLSTELGCKHFDTDDFYWAKTEPPYQLKTSVDKRIEQMNEFLLKCEKWILSGSLCGWGDVFIPYFDLVIFLWIPENIRMKRLLEREKQRYGKEINKEGTMYEAHLAFMEWASKYDSGGLEVRSKKLHYKWLDNLSCKILRMEEDIDLDEKVQRVKEFINKGNY